MNDMALRKQMLGGKIWGNRHNIPQNSGNALVLETDGSTLPTGDGSHGGV